MANFRTSSVFRFTRDFELLKKIIRNGIVPNYCEEDLSFNGTEFCVGIPMASFCDIPITLLDEHNKRYGNYGIALTKQWAHANGLSPVMYVSNENILASVYYHYNTNKQVLDWYNSKEVQDSLMRETILKSLPTAKYMEKLAAEYEHVVNTHIIGYLKKYEGEYQKRPINNYEENEWRFLVPENHNMKWFWNRKEYIKWRFPNGNYKASKPSPSKSLKRYTLNFSFDDLSYILVKDEEFKSRLIEFIENLDKIGGHSKVDSHQKYNILSKIITIEQVKRDF